MIETTLSMANFYSILDALNNSENPCRIKIKCKGSSMAPAIHNNDIVVIKPVDCTKMLRIGIIAVVAYPETKRIIVHRIIKKTQHQFLIKGDNITTPDGWINLTQIIGVIETVSKKRLSYSCRVWMGFVLAQLSKAGILTFLNRLLSYAIRLRRHFGSISIR